MEIVERCGPVLQLPETFASGCPSAKTGHGQRKGGGGQRSCSFDHFKVPGSHWLFSPFLRLLRHGSGPVRMLWAPGL